MAAQQAASKSLAAFAAIKAFEEAEKLADEEA